VLGFAAGADVAGVEVLELAEGVELDEAVGEVVLQRLNPLLP
jgi:hypothetical protein